MSEVSTGAAAPASTGSSEGSSQGTDSNTQNQGAESSQAIKSMKEKFVYKVDGEDVEEEFDLSNKEELTKRLRLSRAAEKRLSEAKEVKSKAWDIIKQFEDDPVSVLKRLPQGKGREIAEKFLLEQIRAETMTEEERERLAEKQELEALRNEKKKTQEDRDRESREKEANKYRETYEKTIIEALNKCNLPKTPALVAKMASLLKKKVSLGIELDASDLADEVRKDTSSVIKSIVKDADGAQLLALLGDEVANKIRKHDLSKLQENQKPFIGQKAVIKKDSDQSSEKPKKTLREWREELDQRLK